jgi:DNA polymerase
MFIGEVNGPKFKDGTANIWHSDAIIDAIRAAAVAEDLGTFLRIAQTVEEWRASHFDEFKVKDPVTVPDCFKSVVRSLFIPAHGKVFVGADYAQIEGRGAAWLAEDSPALEAYENNDRDPKKYPDVYCLMAADIFNRPITKKDKVERQSGKAAELGCGYGASANALNRVENNAAEFAAAGVTADQVVRAWREKHKATVRYWRTLDVCMKNAIISGRPQMANRIKITYNKISMIMQIHLPVGRPIQYHNPLIQPSPKFEGMQEIVYENYRKGEGEYATMHLWGSKAFENVVQGLCRDLLAAKIVECEQVDLPVVMHTHDELVTEVDEADADSVCEWLGQRMSEGPEWADGFPMKGEPSIMRRYGKG